MSTPQPVGVADNANILLWDDGGSTADLWVSVNNGDLSSHYTYGPYPGWSARAVAAGSYAVPRILWTKTDGSAALWSVDGRGGYTFHNYGPYPGWTAVGLAVGGDNVLHIMWNNTNGAMSLWLMDPAGDAPNSGTGTSTQNTYGPYPAWTALSLAVDSNNTPRILWNHPSDGTTSLWSVAPGGGFTQQNYNNPAGSSPVAVDGSQNPNYGGYAQLLYVASGGTTTITNIYWNGPVSSSYPPPAPGAGGGGGGTGGGTSGGGGGTATPNPHGSYAVTYSGGTLTSSPVGHSGLLTTAYSSTFGDNAYGGSAGFNNSGPTYSAHAAGPITATFTWQPDAGYPNSLPPAQVTVIQRCIASWYAQSAVSGVSGQCNTGLGQSSGTTSGTTGSSVSGISAVVESGSSFTVTCTPSADVFASAGSASTFTNVSFSYTAAAITMSVAGTMRDANGIDNILVGQGATGRWNIPTSLRPYTTYAWNVSGITFQQWSATTPPIGTNPANSQASYYSGGFGDPTKTPAHWYWNDPNNATEKVSCTVTLTPPAGQGNQFSVTATKSVAVQLPTYQATGLGGYMQVNSLDPDGDPNLWAGPTGPMLGNGNPAGMNWHCSVYTPTTPAFGTGSMELIQLVTPSSSYTTQTTPATPTTPAIPGQTYTNPLTGVQGLDLTYPYGGGSEASQPYNDNDAPGFHLNKAGTSGNIVVGSATFQSSYIDYLMYMPPSAGNGTQWIALAQFTWSTNGSATIPDSKIWTDYAKQHGSDAAGTVSPSISTPFAGVMGPAFFPMWKKVNGRVSF